MGVVITRLVKDSNFIKLIEAENKRVLNLQNNTHGQKNVDWKLVQNEEERSNVKTKEDMIKLLEKARMKDANTYLNLVDEYNFHMLKIKESYPELSMLKDSDRQSVINAARNQLLALNKN